MQRPRERMGEILDLRGREMRKHSRGVRKSIPFGLGPWNPQPLHGGFFFQLDDPKEKKESE